MGMGYWVHGMCAIGFAFLLCAASANAQEQPRLLNLMPMPANLQTGSGSLRIDSSFSVALTGHTEGRLDRAVQRFLRQLSRQTALPLSATLRNSGPGNGISVQPSGHSLPVIASGPLIGFKHFLRSKLAMWPLESTVHTTPSVVRSMPREP